MRRITLPSRGNFGEGTGLPCVLLMRLRQRLISAQRSLYSLVMRDVASGPEITDPSSVLEKYSNKENHLSSNPKHSIEEVTPTTSGTLETAAGSSIVEKEVSSNINLTTNLNPTTPVSGRDSIIIIFSNRE